MPEKQPNRRTRASSRGMHVSMLRMAVFSGAQPAPGPVDDYEGLLHWPRIPVTVGPQSAQLCFPRFQASPPRERGAAGRWRGGAALLLGPHS